METKGEDIAPLDKNESTEDPLSSNVPSSSSVEISEQCHGNSDQLMNYKEIMLKKQFDLKKKEEEVQEYVEKLTKIKSKVKLLRRNTDTSFAEQTDSISNKKKDDDKNIGGNDPYDGNDDDDHHISDERAKTPKAKSHLLQRKLAENRRIFEQRNKELSESKRAVEEKVEEIRQQINDSDLLIGKDKKLIELNEKINELQAIIIDLQDNLKEKDSVIDSKTRAITLMSEDLSKKGKTTLDTLEETKNEMRSMQENFIQVESSLKTKIDHLINQLETKEQNLDTIQHEYDLVKLNNVEKDQKIMELEVKTQELMNLIDKKDVDSNIDEEHKENIEKLKHELEESNKNMIKIKAQHKNKLKKLQKQLENFRTMSDANAEVIRLENQITLLEEEKGNLQLSLVDFDELKATNEELQRRIGELENQTITQTEEIQKHIEAIATLENQKLDLIQELHGVKQEISALENENAEAENLRVTAELKVVELEEQLEKLHNKNGIDGDNTIIIDDAVESEKIEGIDKKSTDSSGSSESFERIMDPSHSGMAVLTTETTQSHEISQLNEKMSYLIEENTELVIKLTKLQEEMSEHENCREKLEQLMTENQQLIDNNVQNSIDKQTLMSLESENVHLQQLLDSGNIEYNKLITETTIKGENADLIQKNLNDNILMLEGKLTEAESTIKLLEDTIETKNQIIKDLNNNLSHNEEEIRELKANIDKLSNIIEEKTNFYSNLKRELRNTIEQLEIKIKNSEEIIQNMKEDSEKKINIDENLTEQKNQDILILNLTANNEILMQTNLNLNEEIESLRAKDTLAKQTIDELESKIRDHVHNIEENAEKIKQLEGQLEIDRVSHEQKVQSLKIDYENFAELTTSKSDLLKEDIEILEGKLQQKNNVLSKMEEKQQEILEINSELRSNIENLQMQISILNENLSEKDESIIQNIAEIDKLRAELREKKNKYNEKLLMIEQARDELAQRLQQQIMQYNDKLSLYEQLSIQLENQLKYNDDIKHELSDANNIIKQLTAEHEEVIMNLRQQLNIKGDENYKLKMIIEDKNEEDNIKVALKEKILLLESKLEEANNNTQTQLHKMKVIAANLKKKNVQYQELETKFHQEEEKWMLEKQEKDDMNAKIILLDKINEENEEVFKKMEIDLRKAELDVDNEKATRNELLVEFNDYKEKSLMEMAEKERELMEVKEKARELGVRMQVMEAEYLEQLNIIHKSETEHRLLLSKFSQVNESVENMKIESNELKNQLESMRVEMNEVKKESSNEIIEKSKIINDLIMERDEFKIKIQELISKLDVYREEKAELIQKYEELVQKNELLENIQIESQELKGHIESLQAEINEIKRVSTMELNEKINIINDIMIERNEIEAKLKEVMGKIDYCKKNTEENINVHDNTQFLSAESSEILFDASKCFTSSVKEENEIFNLKKLLDDQKNEHQVIINSNEQLNLEIAQLKQKLNDLHVDSDKNKLNIEDKELSEAIKIEEEEEWGWNAKEAEITSNIGHLQPFSTIETQLNAKIAELEDTIKDINDEKTCLNEELKLIQIKNGKLIRKLKEYKIQNESLQQQLKIQMTSGGLCDLDSAIEEELKGQVSKLEKNLKEITIENDKIILERTNLMKRIDVLIAANESFTDMKERQDRELEVLHIRNNELMEKIKILDEKHTNDNNTCNKCTDKISELQENVNLLAVENEELRQLIEREKNKFVDEIHKIEENKSQMEEELKVNFYDMLEKSHNNEKLCHNTLAEAHQEKLSLQNVQENLIAANEKIGNLEEKIVEKQLTIRNYEETIENIHANLNEKIQQLAESNEKIQEMEINLTNELSAKQMEIQLLNETIENLRLSTDKSINELRNHKEETEKLINNLREEITENELKIQTLENNLEISHDTLNKQIAESLVLQQQLEELKINSEIHLKRCQELELKCSEDLKGANEERMNVKEAQDLLVAESSDKIAEKDLNIKVMEENFNLALKESEKWRTICQELEQKLNEVNDNMATVTELLNVRVQEVADLKQYIQRLEFDKHELENCSVNVDNLNRKLIDNDNEIISITSKYKLQIDEKLQDIVNLQSQISILNLERDETLLKLNNQAEEMKLLKDSINNSEILISTLKTQISSKDDIIFQLQQQIANCTEEMQRLTAVIPELETSLLNTGNDLNKQISESAEKTKKIEELEAELIKSNSITEIKVDEHKLIENDLRNQLVAKDEEIDDLKYILNESTYPAIIQELQNKIDKLYEEKAKLEQSLLPNLENLSDRQAQAIEIIKQNKITSENSNELDVALYMLHQRDVRCEELTHELMQLLEERDTLQLRLSNAIRVNEELRKLSSPAIISKNIEQDTDDRVETEHQEAIVLDEKFPTSLTPSQSADSDDEKKMLAQKLSQLHNVGHRKDVRLLDERELRNTQQMSLIAHKDALSTLPPDAAARLINANYTLSRDMQSQSSVLLNWLWGKSTPKVVHM